MEITKQKQPFYQRLALVLLSFSLILTILYIGSNIIMPLLLAMLIAILLRPVVVFFNKKIKIPHVIAVLIAVLLFVVFVVSVVFFISWQVSDFVDDWPKIQHNMTVNYENMQRWIKDSFNISYRKQETYLESVKNDSFNNKNELVGNTISTFSSTLLNLVLIPIYTFLILLYRNLFKKFLSKLVAKDNHSILIDILLEIKLVVQSYIVGLLIEMGIVAILTTLGLMIIGVPYAILLGTITAILNLIPYIGILVAGAISIVAALTNYTDISMALGVIAVNAIVQLIDNNFLVPKIVASKVKLNALVSILAVFAGGAVGGIMGMFLAIPMSAILKVIFDRIEGLKPWGYLFGDDMPKTYEWGILKLPALSAGNENEESMHAELSEEEKDLIKQENIHKQKGPDRRESGE
jgi:predicted PurR-regulated permease PerM